MRTPEAVAAEIVMLTDDDEGAALIAIVQARDAEVWNEAIEEAAHVVCSCCSNPAEVRTLKR